MSLNTTVPTNINDTYAVPSLPVENISNKEDKANKGIANGYAPLDGTGKVPEANLPAIDVSGQIATHNSATTSVHGIANTGELIHSTVIGPNTDKVVTFNESGANGANSEIGAWGFGVAGNNADAYIEPTGLTVEGSGKSIFIGSDKITFNGSGKIHFGGNYGGSLDLSGGGNADPNYEIYNGDGMGAKGGSIDLRGGNGGQDGWASSGGLIQLLGANGDDGVSGSAGQIIMNGGTHQGNAGSIIANGAPNRSAGSLNMSAFYNNFSGLGGAGGSINTSGGTSGSGGSINLSAGANEDGNNGGSIIATAGEGGGANGGTLNMSGGTFNNTSGGNINTSGGIGENSFGGSINTSNGGGSIDTSNGGGSIKTGGTTTDYVERIVLPSSCGEYSGDYINGRTFSPDYYTQNPSFQDWFKVSNNKVLITLELDSMFYLRDTGIEYPWPDVYLASSSNLTNWSAQGQITKVTVSGFTGEYSTSNGVYISSGDGYFNNNNGCIIEFSGTQPTHILGVPNHDTGSQATVATKVGANWVLSAGVTATSLTVALDTGVPSTFTATLTDNTKAGGSIVTSGGGGSINTAVGYIDLGTPTTRTRLKNSLVNGVTSVLPSTSGTLALQNHVHGNITNTGSIGFLANKPLITTTSGVVTTGTFGTTANTFCQGNDSRLSDARTPASHTHGNITNDGKVLVPYGGILSATGVDAGSFSNDTFPMIQGSGTGGVITVLNGVISVTSAGSGYVDGVATKAGGSRFNLVTQSTQNAPADLPLVTTSGGVITTGAIRPYVITMAHSSITYSANGSVHYFGNFNDSGLSGPSQNADQKNFILPYSAKLVGAGLTFYSQGSTPANTTNTTQATITYDICEKASADSSSVTTTGTIMSANIHGAPTAKCFSTTATGLNIQLTAGKHYVIRMTGGQFTTYPSQFRSVLMLWLQ